MDEHFMCHKCKKILAIPFMVTKRMIYLINTGFHEGYYLCPECFNKRMKGGKNGRKN